jgi:hypothetical protein
MTTDSTHMGVLSLLVVDTGNIKKKKVKHSNWQTENP